MLCANVHVRLHCWFVSSFNRCRAAFEAGWFGPQDRGSCHCQCACFALYCRRPSAKEHSFPFWCAFIHFNCCLLATFLIVWCCRLCGGCDELRSRHSVIV